MSKKYPGHNTNDTFWDDTHRKRGMMTNNEFFTSSGPGGFYEGMEWDEEDGEWVPDAKARAREAEIEAEEVANECDGGCGFPKTSCHCW